MSKRVFGFLSLLLGLTTQLYCGNVFGLVVQHNDCQVFPLGPTGVEGSLQNVSQGAQELEIWRSHIAFGGATPAHTHDTEELFIFIKGQGKAIIGDQVLYFSAPCTLIFPANVRHQVFNLGREPTDHFAILPKRSKILDEEGLPMDLPWRSSCTPIDPLD